MGKRRFVWEVVLRPCWRWLVVAPFAAMGAWQQSREWAVDIKWAEPNAIALPSYLDAGWQSYLLIALALTVLLILWSAHKVTKEIEVTSRNRLQEERYNHERILQERERAHARPVPPRFSVTHSFYPAKGVESLPVREAHANLTVLLESPEPLKCRALGAIIASNIHLRNHLRSYEAKWQGTPDAEVTLEPGMPRVLNVVAFGRPPFSRWVPVGVRSGLHFLTAGTHTTKGYFTEAERLDPFSAATRILDPGGQRIVLRIHIAAWSLYNEASRYSWTQHFMVTRGASLADIGFTPINVEDIPEEWLLHETK